jgi:predicted TIM-barrel fold metal-dependent hydrolase
MFDTLRRWPTHWRRLASENPDITADQVLANFGQQIVKVIASAWWGPEGPIITNDSVAAIARRHPGRVEGLASVDISRPMEGVRELRRCVKDYGFKGLRVLPWLWGLPPDDRRYYPLYSECVELGVAFCLQVGHTGPMYPSEPGRPIPYLDNVAHDFPELTIVAGHIGFPWVSEMISLAMKYPNVYIDTSAYKAARFPREFVDYMRGAGRKKIIFASDYPVLTPDQCLADLDSLELTEETKSLFLRGNAEKAFRIQS